MFSPWVKKKVVLLSDASSLQNGAETGGLDIAFRRALGGDT